MSERGYSRGAVSESGIQELYGREAGARVYRMLVGLVEVLKPQDRILSWSEVVEMTTLSKRTIQRLMDDGDFPARVILTPNRYGWRLSDIAQWIRDRPDQDPGR